MDGGFHTCDKDPLAVSQEEEKEEDGKQIRKSR